MKEFANKLGPSFWFGVLLLLCVCTATVAGVIGHNNGRQEAYVELTQCSDSQDDLAEESKECEHCQQCESLIDRLQDKLLETRNELAQARAQRLQSRLDRLAEDLETKTANEEQPRMVASAEEQWHQAKPLPAQSVVPKKIGDKERSGLLRFRLR